MLDAARPHLLRVLGPGSIGMLSPHIGLNASLAPADAAAGELALVSQSGSLVAAMLDWARARHIGFSQVVSLGEHADVDVGDLLDQLASDVRTRAILLYIESADAPRKFLSAARCRGAQQAGDRGALPARRRGGRQRPGVRRGHRPRRHAARGHAAGHVAGGGDADALSCQPQRAAGHRQQRQRRGGAGRQRRRACRRAPVQPAGFDAAGAAAAAGPDRDAGRAAAAARSRHAGTGTHRRCSCWPPTPRRRRCC